MPKRQPIPWYEWTGPYRQFEEIACRVLEGHVNNEGMVTREINDRMHAEVEALYVQHKGEPAWDEAYRRWHEWDDEDEAHVIDESSVILK